MTLTRANKEHECLYCQEPIAKGDLYLSNAVWETKPDPLTDNKQEKFHLTCVNEDFLCSWQLAYGNIKRELKDIGFHFKRNTFLITHNPFDGIAIAEKLYAKNKQTRREVRERRANVESASRNSGAQVANNQPISTERPQ